MYFFHSWCTWTEQNQGTIFMYLCVCLFILHQHEEIIFFFKKKSASTTGWALRPPCFPSIQLLRHLLTLFWVKVMMTDLLFQGVLLLQPLLCHWLRCLLYCAGGGGGGVVGLPWPSGWNANPAFVRCSVRGTTAAFQLLIPFILD